MSGILLETGTGELEVVEFMINNQYYAINVLKVKEIIQIAEITPLPQMTEEILGLSNIRGEMNIVVDLDRVLHKRNIGDYKNSLGLLCEFNETKVIFLVEKVEGIRRILWKDINQASHIQEDSLSIGSILIDETIIILLDFESIVLGLGMGNGYEKQTEVLKDRKGKERQEHIVLVEDSKAIGEILKCALIEAGYKNIKVFSNGKEAQDYIFGLRNQLGENFKEEIDLLITDIEMPILDGYTLTKSIKEDQILKELPVIIFSSLITEELKYKGKEVGADMQISKPSMKKLVEKISEFFDK